MVTDIIKGHHYKATIVGYNDKDSVFVELENKFTAYLDVSMYNYTEKEVESKFRVMQTLDVVVTNVDKSDSIKCVEFNLYNSNKNEPKKSKKQEKSQKSESLMFNLGSIMQNIKLNEK